MMNQKFKDYSSSLEAVAEHVKRWSPKYSNAKSPEEAISMIARSYATDPNYARTVSQIIRQQKNAIPTTTAASSSPVAAPVGANLGTNGAVQVSGSSTGYTVAMSGNVAVVPANSGSEASAVAQQTSSSVNQTRMAQMMTGKVDKMIDITQEHVRDTRRAVNV